jgi:hypothetical protein
MISAAQKLADDLAFAKSQERDGRECVVITDQATVRGVLLEIEEVDALNKKYFTELETLRAKCKPSN